MSSQRLSKQGSSFKDSLSLLSWSSMLEYNYTMANLEKLVGTVSHIPKPHVLLQDKQDVLRLPAIVDGPKKSSTTLQRYKRRREQEYVDVIDNMKQQMQDINDDVADKIRYHAEFLKKEIAETDGQMEKIVFTTKFDKKKYLNIPIGEFQNICHKLYNSQLKKRQNIRRYYSLLKKLEHERSNFFKNILRNTFQYLIKTSNKTPQEIENFIENEIQKINGITLSNLRHYSDLTYHLLAVSENTLFNYLHQVQLNKEKWNRYNSLKAIKHLNKSKLRTGFKPMFDERASSYYRNIVSVTEEFHEKYTSMHVLHITQEDYDNFSYQVAQYLTEINTNVTTVIDVFKLTINNIFCGYLKSWESLRMTMKEHSKITEADLHVLKSDYIVPAMESASLEFTEKLKQLNITWKDIQENLGSRLEKALEFLKTCTYVWCTYTQNVQRANYLIIVEMVLKIMANNNTMKTFRIKLNTLLDNLREAPNKQELDISLTTIYDFLDKIKKLYQTNSSKENAIVEKYMLYANNIIDVLIDQLKEILYYKPSDIGAESTKMGTRASQIILPIEEEEENLFSVEVKMCKHHMNALNNWCQGLEEALINYLKTCRIDLLKEAESWINGIIARNNARINVKLNCHNLFYKEIKENIYDVRKMEISIHEQTLKRHDDAIQNIINKFPECYELCESKMKIFYETSKEQMQEISKKYDTVNKVAEVTDLQVELKNLNEESETVTQELKEQFNSDIETRSYQIVKSTQDFRKHIKLFSEDGNFHKLEANYFIKELASIEKKAYKKCQIFLKDSSKKLNKVTLDYKKVYVNTEQRLDTLKNEIKIRDSTILAIKRLQSEIRKIAFDFKYSYKSLIAVYQKFLKKSPFFLGNPESVDEIKCLINDIIDTTEKFYSKLLIPTDILIESMQYLKEMQTENNLNSFMVFYKIKPTVDESFMSEIANQIYDTYEIIYTEAKAFYEGKTSFISKNKLQPDLNSFMAEVVDKFKYYHLQCEPIWIEQTKCFCELTTEFQVFMIKYKDIFYEAFNKIQYENAMKLQNKIRRFIKSLKESNYASFKKVHNQLKPLHGHPKNKHLLSEIEESMKTELKLLSDNISIGLIPLKEEYYTNQSYFHETFSIVENELNQIVNLLECKDKYNPLIEQYEGKLSYIESIVEKCDDQIVCDTVKSSRSNVIVEMKSKADLDPTLPRDDIPLTNASSTKIWNQLSVYNNTLTENKTINEFIEEYDNSMEKFMQEIDAYEQLLQTDIKEWYKIWCNDIERVLKLYTVKYDIKHDI